MDIFVIYYRDDYDRVQKRVDQLKKNGRKANFIIHQASEPNWRHSVKRDIHDCNCVVMFAGAKTWNSPKVAWEIRVAKKYKKTIYVVRLDPAAPIHEQVFRRFPVWCRKKDRNRLELILERQKNRTYAYLVNQETFNEQIAKFEKKDFGVFKRANHENKPFSKDEMAVLFEEYTLFVKTSEDLVSRRQNVNTFYIAIQSALLAFQGVLFEAEINDFVEIVYMMIMSVIGLWTSISWRKMLISYGELNKGKMRVIAELEKQLPASLFDAEWRAVKNPMNGYEYKSYTDREKRIPVLFAIANGVSCFIWVIYAVFFVVHQLAARQTIIQDGSISALINCIGSMLMNN